MFKNCSEYPASRLSLILASVTGAAVLLAACGGGGGGGGGGTQLHLQALKRPSSILTGDVPTFNILAGSKSSNAPSLESRANVRQQRSYAHAAIGLPSNLPVRQQGQGVTVAVADGGIEVGHPDLKASFHLDSPLRAGQRSPFDPTKDVLGHNFLADPDDRDDGYNLLPRTNAGRSNLSHATHVAGIIAAQDNDIGVVGIAPAAKILPLRVIPEGNPFTRRYRADVDPGHPSISDLDKNWSTMMSYLRLDWGNQQGTFRQGHVPIPGYSIPFVMNNSWSTNWRPRVVEIDLPGSQKGYFLQPRVVKNGYQEFTSRLFSNDSQMQMKLLNAEGALGTIVVFAAGNDGWNSETGEIPVFDRHLSGEDIHGYLNPDVITPIGYLDADSPQIKRTGTPSNLPSPISAAFIGNSQLEGVWLAVVAIDKSNQIAPFSNGCGEAAKYCIAAPGVRVISTVSHQDEKYENHYYGVESGTSMAVPVVSGALAVLKSTHPTLTARQAVDIMLRTATDLGKPGIDSVYGHGLVNLTRALAPIGQVAAAGQNAQRVVDPGRSRIAFSAAFGDAAPSMALNFGGLDSFGRVYKFHAPLQDRVLPGPQLAGMMARSSAAFSAQPPTRIGDNGAGASTLLQTSTTPDSAIGDGSRISFVTARNLTTLTLARRQTSSQLSPSNLMMDGVYSGPSSAGPSSAGVSSAGPSNAVQPGTGHAVWASFAPQARNVVRMETGWSLASHVVAGAYASSAKAMHATRRAEGYRIRDFGTHAHFDDGVSAVHMRIGQVHENGRFLGSKSEGAYALNRPTRSNYLHVSARRQLRPGLTVGASLMRLRSHVDFRHNAFVADTQLTAQSAGAYLSLADMIRPGHRLTLHHGAPLAVTSGTIRQTSVAGYTDDGVYRTDSTDVALGVTARHRMTQIVYQAPLAKHIHGFAALARHDNWSHRRGLDNNLLMLGLTMKR